MDEVNPKTGRAGEAGEARQARRVPFARGLEQDECADGHQHNVQAGITAEGEFVVLRGQVEVENCEGEGKSRCEQAQRGPQVTRRGFQPSEIETEQEVAHVTCGIIKFKSVFQRRKLFQDEHDGHDNEPERDVVKNVRVFGFGNEQAQDGRKKVQADERIEEPQVRGARSAQDADEHLEDRVESHPRLGEGVRGVHVIENGPGEEGDEDFGGALLEERPGVLLFGEQQVPAHQEEERDAVAGEGIVNFLNPVWPAAPHVNVRQDNEERADKAREIHPGEDAIGGLLFVFCQLVVHG